MAGLVIGCFNAWHWVSREDKAMRDEQEGFVLPNAISAITPLVGQILSKMETQREKGAITQV